MSTIPSWFKLSDYGFVNKLSYKKLAEQLYLRRHLYLNIKDVGWNTKNQKRVDNLIKTKFLPTSDSTSNLFRNPVEIKSRNTKKLVREVVMDDFDCFIHKPSDTLVYVDLIAPDTVLLEQFERLLIKKRKSIKNKKSDFKKLRGEYPIIPYLDLLIWSELKQEKLKPKDLMSALSPLKDTEDSFIHKTMKGFITKVLDKQFLFELSTFPE